MSLDIDLFKSLLWPNYENIVKAIEKGGDVNGSVSYPYIINKHPHEKNYNDFEITDEAKNYLSNPCEVKKYSFLEYAKLRVDDDRIIELLMSKGAK
jgi:hypothetical protein